MANGAPEPSNDEYSMCLKGLRQQAEAHAVDVNDENIHRFILHQAEVAAQDVATIRWLFNILNPTDLETPKGQTTAQTVSSLQRIMAADAVTIWEQDRQLTQAHVTIASLQKRLLKRKSKLTDN